MWGFSEWELMLCECVGTARDEGEAEGLGRCKLYCF